MARLEIVLSAIDNASGKLRNVDGALGSLGKTAGGVMKLGVLGGAAALGVLAVAGLDFVKQAMEEEAGIKRLAQAVDSSGGSWAKSGAAIETVIKARQKLAFSDDELRSSLALLTAITGDADEALRRQTVAMDFARGANIDLGTASKLLGKVTDETVNVLGRYGIRVKEGADATDVLALVQQKFAGQSQAFAESTAGKWAKFNIALDNVKETIGAALLPLASKLADTMSGFLERHEEQIGRVAQAWATFAGKVLGEVVLAIQLVIGGFREGDVTSSGWHGTMESIGLTLRTVVIPALKDTYDALGSLGDWLLNNKDALILAIVGIGLAFAWTNPLIAVLVGAGGVVVALQLFQTNINALPAPLLALRIKILELALTFVGLGDKIIGVLSFMGGFEREKESLAGWRASIERDLGAANSQLFNVTHSAADAKRALENLNGTSASVRVALNWIGLHSGTPIPGMQHGGVVTRPTLALLGERGPEAVIPLSRGTPALAGATFHIGPVYLGGAATRGDVRDLVDMIEGEWRDRRRRGM